MNRFVDNFGYDDAFVLRDALESYQNSLGMRQEKVRDLLTHVEKDIGEWDENKKSEGRIVTLEDL